MDFFKHNSWKTSGAGIAAILVAVGSAITAVTDNDPTTSIDVGALIAALMAGIGLIFARDNNKSSEDIGSK
jgi:hypothetical protein